MAKCLINIYLVSIFLLQNVAEALCQEQNSDTVVIGAFVSSIHDFDITNNTINADIHLWCLYEDSAYDFENELEFVYCNNVELGGSSIEDIEEKKWFYTKAIIESRQRYSTINYPFDNQKIIFGIESSEYTTDDFIFKVDTTGSNLDSIVYKQFDEWTIVDKTFIAKEARYNSSFGDPTALNSSSPRFDIIIDIKRKDSWLILFKLITGILVAFLISTCVFWIKPTNTDPRFGLCVGGLFAAIGNKYIVESIVPSTNELTLLDYLHNLTFIAIFLIIILSVISLKLYESEDENLMNKSRKLDLISYSSLNVIYFCSFAYLIIKFSI